MSRIVTLIEDSTPAAPQGGRLELYAKTDHRIYLLGPDGVERLQGQSQDAGFPVPLGAQAQLPSAVIRYQPIRISSPGYVTSLSIYTNNFSGGGRAWIGLYDSSGPQPNSRLASALVPSTTGVSEMALDSPVRVTRNTYWLAYVAENSSLVYFVSPTGLYATCVSGPTQTFATGLPASAGGPNLDSGFVIQAWATVYP